MELIGKPAISPLLFYSGKLAGYITWIVFGYAFARKGVSFLSAFSWNEALSFFCFATGGIFTGMSVFQLGQSIRLGLPEEGTVLKTNGIYRISRNPMYLGFGLFTAASAFYTLDWLVALAGIYSLVVYHLIIKSEERFLLERFGNEYKQYRNRVRRYL